MVHTRKITVYRVTVQVHVTSNISNVPWGVGVRKNLGTGSGATGCSSDLLCVCESEQDRDYDGGSDRSDVPAEKRQNTGWHNRPGGPARSHTVPLRLLSLLGVSR